jgi:hypothetical protein
VENVIIEIKWLFQISSPKILLILLEKDVEKVSKNWLQTVIDCIACNNGNGFLNPTLQG